MKYLSIFTLIVLFVGPITAQDETLFNDEIESGGYGGPICKIGQINGNTGAFSLEVREDGLLIIVLHWAVKDMYWPVRWILRIYKIFQ